ncbi:General stress protein 69 [Poriferisphaera corsica]|uniref:General stress protein 69 n=1 Tax=Poriferisphaera corsica TaxID=2528020 RepID=A0A517YY35_9BACT|nr:aldo/keto reductase [Poriferisphaera corsica]QDU35117.1 General stress protein 69 [Poriferisphaera corsica]
MRKHILGNSNLEASILGFGCMGLSEFYGPPTEEAESLNILNHAYHNGINFFDTADIYGCGHNEQLLSKFIRDKRSKIILATKCAIVRKPGEYARKIDNSPQYIHNACDASLKRLQTDYIDLYYIHRFSGETPIEDVMHALAKLKTQGKIRQIGLSEVSANTLRKACKITPVAALQTEYSISTRDVEADILPTCHDVGTGFVSYSPLGRGLLTGQIKSLNDLADDDFRRISPRFNEENFNNNLKRLSLLNDLAQSKNCTPGQIAIAWLLHRPVPIFPIPGTKRIKYLDQNIQAANIELTRDEISLIDNSFPPGFFGGQRYPEAGMTGINT